MTKVVFETTMPWDTWQSAVWLLAEARNATSVVESPQRLLDSAGWLLAEARWWADQLSMYEYERDPFLWEDGGFPWEQP